MKRIHKGFLALGFGLPLAILTASAAFWGLLTVTEPDKSCLPAIYIDCPAGVPQEWQGKRCGRSLHDDWEGFLRKISRSDTYFCIPFPPKKFAGTQELKWTLRQAGYEFMPGTEFHAVDPGAFPPSAGVTEQFLAPPPVPDINKWIVISAPLRVPFTDQRAYVPVYIGISLAVLDQYRLHMNFGLKPDTSVTFDKYGPHWGPEFSPEGTRLRPPDGYHVGDYHYGFIEASFSWRELRPHERASLGLTGALWKTKNQGSPSPMYGGYLSDAILL